MKFSEETLMAYADGELDAAARAEIESAMQSDPQIAQEIDRHRALRAQLHGAFSDDLAEEIPDRLLEVARTAPAGNASNVLDLNAAREARPRVAARPWSVPQWAAIAASLVIGIIGTRLALQDDSGPFVADEGSLLAGNRLAAALNDQAGGTRSAQGVQIGISFMARSGNYCRTFTLGENSSLAGVACREDEHWRVKATSQNETAAGGDYRMAASSLPPAILRTIDDSISGEALDAEDEAAARSRGWKK